AEQKKFAAAMTDLESVGDGWQGTLAMIDGSIVEAVKYYLAGGEALGKLREAYGLTEAQAKSIDTAWKEQIKTAKELAKVEAGLATTPVGEEGGLFARTNLKGIEKVGLLDRTTIPNLDEFVKEYERNEN